MIVGIDVGGRFIKAGGVEKGKIRKREKIRTPHKPEELINLLSGLVEQINGNPVGIGFPGLVNPCEGIVLNPPNFPFIDKLEVKKEIEKRTGREVWVGNDATLYALGEACYGRGKGKKVVCVFTLGTGIGGGIVIDGKPYMGVHGYAGEVGHLTIDTDGPVCGCGNRGCVESYAGADRMVERARSLGLQVETPEDISKLVMEGEERARRVFEEMGRYIGTGVAGVILLFDPDIVIIGGGVSKAGRILIDAIREEAERRVYLPSVPPIEPAILGDDAGILGAAKFAELRGERALHPRSLL
ncbi:hypothetical protein DRQ20_01120 [bacterium]|nr:MAG: hypothetical protein DRQ20_01120 [bacterium]